MGGANNSIVFTVEPTRTSNKIVLSNLTSPKDATVYWWGDGSKDVISSSTTSLTHTYDSSITSVDITIIGKLGGFWNSTSNITYRDAVTNVKKIDSVYLTSLYYTFAYGNWIEYLPRSIYAPNLTNCSYAFYNCKSIISEFPYLWVFNPSANHTSCFTNSFLNYYIKYGINSCTQVSTSTYTTTLAEYVNNDYSKCKYIGDFYNNTAKTLLDFYIHTLCISPPVTRCEKYDPNNKGCTIYCKQSAYMECPAPPNDRKCTYTNIIRCKHINCNVKVEVTKHTCNLANSTCVSADCPYAVYNQTSVDAAIAAGLA